MTFSPLLRTLAVTSLVGTAMLTASIGPAAAQTQAQTPTAKAPAAAAATSARPETVEQRITTLKTALKITPDQEGKWDGVAKAMRDNATAMDKLVQDKRGKMAKMNAVDDLKTYQELTQAHLDGQKKMISAFQSLYDSMPAEQKANADGVFDTFGPAAAGKQG
jgi:protein CpxP